MANSHEGRVLPPVAVAVLDPVAVVVPLKAADGHASVATVGGRPMQEARIPVGVVLERRAVGPPEHRPHVQVYPKRAEESDGEAVACVVRHTSGVSREF